MTARTSRSGEILATRYQLVEHINNDALGRQVWRGIDVVLRRPIAVVLRHPGGPTAVEMISAAVAASRITHPHLVDVYDAIDEGDRAYVVREWVDGSSLRELVADGPLDSIRATAVAHSVASAVSAAHATGMVHGNVHPGTVLVGDDGRVLLSDARADDAATPEDDVRATGAVLYCALTGHWPHAEAGVDRLPDGVRDANGTLASPRQVRGGLPSYLSELATGLLDLNVEPPTAEMLALDLGRLDTEANDELFGDGGPLSFASTAPSRGRDGQSRGGRKVAIGVVALLVIAGAGLLLASKLGSDANAQSSTGGHPSSTHSASPRPTTSHQTNIISGSALHSVRIIESKGNGKERAGVEKINDGDDKTYWKSDWYLSPEFGQDKPGMGLLIDLGSAKDVTSVTVDFLLPGVTAEARTGSTDPGVSNPTNANDAKLLAQFKPVGTAGPQPAGSNQVFPIGENTRYVLIWVTSLPPAGKYSTKPGSYLFGINEVSVNTQ
jgi:tRNA A-37 threonylcarbamoyl transferase component Bud32